MDVILVIEWIFDGVVMFALFLDDESNTCSVIIHLIIIIISMMLSNISITISAIGYMCFLIVYYYFFFKKQKGGY